MFGVKTITFFTVKVTDCEQFKLVLAENEELIQLVPHVPTTDYHTGHSSYNIDVFIQTWVPQEAVLSDSDEAPAVFAAQDQPETS